jgi:phosphoglycolate phosphatase
MTTFDLILFDLDGTLTDSAPGVTRAAQYALNKMGFTVDDPDKLLSFVGPPLIKSFQGYMGSDETVLARALEHYREYYADQGIFENSVFSGIPEALAVLLEKGKTLAVATSKPTVYTDRILDHYRLRDFFTIVVGCDMDGSRTEKGEVIAEVLAHAEVKRLSCPVMVGDRKYDIIGARQNGIPVIAAGWGYGTREEFIREKPDYIADTIPDLLALLNGNEQRNNV